jgi:hypothetical protein
MVRILFALLVSQFAYGVSLEALDDLTLSTSDGSEVSWLGDGFTLSCSKSKSCKISARRFEPGEYWVKFYRWEDETLRYGTISFNVLKTLSKKSHEINVSLSQEVNLKDSFQVPFKGYGIHNQNGESLYIKDFLQKISHNHTIKGVTDSTILVHLSDLNSALLLGPSSVAVVETSSSDRKLSWQSGNMFVSLEKDQEFNFKSGSVKASSNFFRFFILDKKDELYIFPIVGEGEYNRKSEKARLIAPFGLLLAGKSIEHISTMACEDPYEMKRLNFVTYFPCQNVELSTLGLDPDFLLREDFEVTNPVLKDLKQPIYKRAMQSAPDSFESKLKFQVTNDIEKGDPFLGKLRYFYNREECAEIDLTTAGSIEEKKIATYYQALCSERDGDFRDTSNRLKWLNMSDLEPDLLAASKDVLGRQEEYQLPTGKFSLFIGRDSNAFKKPRLAKLKSLDQYPFQSTAVIGGSLDRQYSLFKEGSLQSDLAFNGDFSLLLARRAVQFASHREGVQIPFRLEAKDFGNFEVAPELQSIGVGYPIDVLGVGVKTKMQFSQLLLGSNYQSFDDVNESAEFIDSASGVPLDLPEGKTSDRSFTRKDYTIGYEQIYSKGKISLQLTKKLTRYLKAVEYDYAFSSVEAKISGSFSFRDYYSLLATLLLENRKYIGHGSARMGSGELEANWDFSPDYALFARLGFQSSKGSSDTLSWKSWTTAVGLTTLWR